MTTGCCSIPTDVCKKNPVVFHYNIPMNRIDFYNYIILLGAGIGFIRFNKILPVLRYFPFFLLLTLCIESLCSLEIIRFRGNNHPLFNVFTTIEFLYYSYLFYSVIDLPARKKLIKWITVFFLLFTFFNFCFIQGFKTFHTISYRVGAIMIAVWCFFYFKQLMRREYVIKPWREAFFWISTGLLFFYLGFFFYFCAFDYIVYTDAAFNEQLFSIISNTLNTLLYCCFSIALLCPGKTMK